ncbi:MAG TPA: hypothetical protein VK494_03220 [Gemmatimonadaceae bacterium]|nr:hypothetical protein [Gemmatimonadaceae bacterium]
MTDDELLAQAPALPVLYFDGFGAYRKVNGLLRCVGYTLELGAQYNLMMSLVGAEEGNRAVRRVLDDAAKGIMIWSGARLAH